MGLAFIAKIASLDLVGWLLWRRYCKKGVR